MFHLSFDEGSVAVTSRTAVIAVVLNHIVTGYHRELRLLKHAPECCVPWVYQIERLQLGLVSYSTSMSAQVLASYLHLLCRAPCANSAQPHTTTLGPILTTESKTTYLGSQPASIKISGTLFPSTHAALCNPFTYLTALCKHVSPSLLSVRSISTPSWSSN